MKKKVPAFSNGAPTVKQAVAVPQVHLNVGQAISVFVVTKRGLEQVEIHVADDGVARVLVSSPTDVLVRTFEQVYGR